MNVQVKAQLICDCKRIISHSNGSDYDKIMAANMLITLEQMHLMQGKINTIKQHLKLDASKLN